MKHQLGKCTYRATSSNLAPSLSFVNASSFLECFSHWSRQSVLFAESEWRQRNGIERTKMCRVLMAVAALSFEPPAFSSLLAEPLPLSLDLSPLLAAGFLLGAIVVDVFEERWVSDMPHGHRE